MKDLIVTNRGPTNNDSGGLIQIFKSLDPEIDSIWYSPVSSSKREQINLDTNLSNTFKHQYIVCPDEMINNQYLLFSNSLIWPIIHEIDEVWTNFLDQNEPKIHEIWQNYLGFLKRLKTIINRTKNIRNLWVCDYQVLGLDLDQVLNKKVFTFFTPFPSLATIKKAGEIVSEYFSLLFIYDRITFQTEKDRHNYLQFRTYRGFKKSQELVISPLGENKRQFDKINYKSNYNDSNQILFVSRIEYTKGILDTLEITDYYLSTYNKTGIVFEFVLEPSRKEVKAYNDYYKKVSKRIQSLKSKYPDNIVYTLDGLPHDKIIEKMVESNTLLTTCTKRDGFNLVVYEMLMSNESNSPKSIIVTEGLGINSHIGIEALNVINNLKDYKLSAEVIFNTIKQTNSEKIERFKNARAKIAKLDNQSFYNKSLLG